MSNEPKKAAHNSKRWTFLGLGVVLLIAMLLGTKVVSNAEASLDSGKFDPVSYADETWDSKVLPAILKNATDLVGLSDAVTADPAAAAKQYGVVEGTSAPVYTVTFSGIAGPVVDGIMPVTVEGLPEGVSVRVQMGPVISGTALRDASGTVHFQQFINQIDYQAAGTALNEKITATVLTNVNATAVAGQQVTVTGVFQLINAASFLVTPVEFEAGQ